MVSIFECLADFGEHVRFFVGVPFFGDDLGPVMQVTVLVEPWTSKAIRAQMRRALKRTVTQDVLADLFRETLGGADADTWNPVLRITIRNDRTLL